MKSVFPIPLVLLAPDPMAKRTRPDETRPCKGRTQSTVWSVPPSTCTWNSHDVEVVGSSLLSPTSSTAVMWGEDIHASSGRGVTSDQRRKEMSNEWRVK
jgi:hypothetical protein